MEKQLASSPSMAAKGEEMHQHMRVIVAINNLSNKIEKLAIINERINLLRSKINGEDQKEMPPRTQLKSGEPGYISLKTFLDSTPSVLDELSDKLVGRTDEILSAIQNLDDIIF